MSRQADYLNEYDSKARRKIKDERRMRFRRAIEAYDDRRRLQAELTDYPDAFALSSLLAAQASSPRSAPRAH